MSTFFDEAASTWDDDPTKTARAAAIADAMGVRLPLTAATRALEFGCGTGLVTWALGNRVGKVILADSSPGMLNVVEQRIAALPADQQQHYEPLLLDADRPALPAASLDLIFAALSLHHVDDVAATLAAFHHALVPGGHLAIADLDHDPEGQFHAHHDHFHGHHGFDREHLARLLSAAGFDSPTFETVTQIEKRTDDGVRTFDVFLAVMSRQVVQSGDGWLLPDRGVGPVVIVGVEPTR